MDKKDLNYLGQPFQYAVLKALIEDPDLLRDIYPILDQNVFTDPYLRQLVGTAKEFYKQIQSAPSYKELETYMRQKARTEDDIQYIKEILDKARNTEDFTTAYVSQTITEYMKWKKFIGMINKAREKVADGWDEKYFGKFMSEIESISQYGMQKASIWRLDEDTVWKTLRQGKEDVITTGIKEVDERMAGGLGRTDVGLFVAPTGFGKTTFGSVLAHNAATAGYKALQIYFEDNPEDILRKHLAILYRERTGWLCNWTDDEIKEFIGKHRYENGWTKINENLILCRMKNHETTVEDIENELIALANEYDFRPDMIVIDYFSCLKHSRNNIKDKWEAQADCMRKIKEHIAFKYNTAVWVMQQTNRTATGRDSEGAMANIQGSYEATQPTSVWIELRRSKDQIQNSRADLIFLKTRKAQRREDLIDIVFDNGTLVIDCKDERLYDESESDGHPHFEHNGK